MSVGALEVLVMLVAIALMLGAFLATIMRRDAYRLEVEPMTAAVIKNIFDGKTRVQFPGSSTLSLGKEKLVRTVSLKNEPSDPPIQKVTTSDRIDVGVDYTITTQQVSPTETNVRNAALAIDYDKRSEVILVRIASALQEVFFKIKLAEIYEKPVGNEPGRMNHERAEELQRGVNDILCREVTIPWGFRVEIKLENIVLPAELMETAEKVEVATKRGKAIKDLADASGVPPEVVFLGEVAADVFKSWNRGGGKGKDKGGES